MSASGAEKAAWILTGAAVLFIFHYHLVPGLVAGLLVYALLHRGARLLHFGRFSRGTAKLLSAVALGLVAAAVTGGLVLLALGFLRGRVGDLPALFERVADVLDQVRGQLQAWGLSIAALEDLVEGGRLREAVSAWLRAHAAQLTHAGGVAGRVLAHALLGIALGLLVFFQHPQAPEGRPLAAALAERMRRLGSAFESVVLAQVEISAVNTVLTGLYLLAVLPLLGAPLPLAGTLLAFTFVAGLLPVVGNLISNTAIVAVSLGVSLWVALLSLTFLVVIHKLEYFLNARIVGARVGASAWEILLAMLALEAAFGLAGIVLAPILYAYVKGELADRGLV